MVSMVMPETGLRAVVAMALAATEVKKNENTRVSARPIKTMGGRAVEVAQERRHRNGAGNHAQQDGHHRDVAVRALRRSRLPAPERAQRHPERAGHDAHGF